MIPAQLLIEAYRQGIFPMAVETGDIAWFSPDPRGILPLDGFHASERLKRRLRSGEFELAIDRSFDEVMRACATRDETWINADILASYSELHRLGYAHSVEAWQAGRLVGGLYGVSLGGAFFGESMFHTVTDASKAALAALVHHLNARGFRLLDVQWTTPHLRSLGALDIPRERYLRLLRDAVRLPCSFS